MSGSISWTHERWSPWRGCMKVSPGCANCYAIDQEALHHAKLGSHWGPPATTSRFLDYAATHWQQPVGWNRTAARLQVRRRVFPSMCDPFELHPQLTEARARFLELIAATPHLDWLLLTKRPELIGSLLPPGDWPNIWLGTSVETQHYANERIPELLQHRQRVPVLFLSVEPQLQEVCLEPWLSELDWVITGGESGKQGRRRPFDLDWARHTRDECRDARVAWHFKQVGGRTHAAGGCLLDGEETKEFPRVVAA